MAHGYLLSFDSWNICYHKYINTFDVVSVTPCYFQQICLESIIISSDDITFVLILLRADPWLVCIIMDLGAMRLVRPFPRILLLC